MDGTPGPLKSWERYYWGVFVSALAFLLFSRLTGRDEVVVDHEVGDSRLPEQFSLRGGGGGAWTMTGDSTAFLAELENAGNGCNLVLRFLAG